MSAVGYAEKASHIFVLSDSFLKIKEMIDDECSTIDDISAVILLDPALSATILRLANSSFFNYPGKIDTVSKAVLVLGITEVYNLVIAYFTTEAFKSMDCDSPYLEKFWQRSVDCALLLKFIGGTLRVPRSERLFILGLLHCLGELVVKQFAPEKLEQCQCDNLNVLPWDKQKEVLGFTFGECTAKLFELWGLPASIYQPIAHQDDDSLQENEIENQLLYIAKRIMLKNIDFPRHFIHDLISDGHMEALSLKEEMIQLAGGYCDVERNAILSVLKPS